MNSWCGSNIVERSLDGKETTSITILQAPWYAHLAEWLCWHVVCRICDGLHHIPLPKWFRNRKWKHITKWSDWMDFKRHKCDSWCEDHKESTWEEYFGDDLASIWHTMVEDKWIKFTFAKFMKRVEHTFQNVPFADVSKFKNVHMETHEACKHCNATGNIENDASCLPCEGIGHKTIKVIGK